VTGTFFGLDLALRALQAQQTGLDVTNHNVANANTEGFSRQNVTITTTEPFAMPALNRPATAGQIGTGAIANNIQRARDGFLDTQWRAEAGSLANASNRQDALEQVEVVLDEPQGVGLSSLFNEYYRVWNELSNDPSASALPVRTTVVQQSLSLTTAFNRIAGQLVSIRTGQNNEIGTDVTEVNDITDQIFQINATIVQAELTGQTANDFRDRRDVLMDRLSQLVQVTSNENTDGSINVLMGAQVLVNGTTAKTDLFTVPNAGNSGYVDITYGSGGPAATVGTAGLGGRLTSRDTTIPGYQTQLDTIASNLITAVNTMHTAGFDANGNPGQPFFTGTNALTISVNAAIQADPRLIAAAGVANAPGNNAVALKIAGLRTSMSAAIPPLAAGTPTSETAYSSLVAGLGTANRTTRNETDTRQSLVELLERRRQSLSGVSLDEEAVNLMRYQRAYEAASRVLTTYDELLDKLINSTGIVGR
jgi:flagellar hook-associated protein 1